MAKEGLTTLIEVSPHPVLTAPAQETLEAAGVDLHAIAVLASLRRQDGGLERFIRSLAEAHAAGIDIDWSSLFATDAGQRVDLPTYAFQPRRYWLAPAGAGSGDAQALGQAAAEHPLLGAMVPLAGGQGTLFTGRLSLESQPWLADHVVLGSVLLPATAFLELALHAAAQADTPTIDDPTLAAPLVLEETTVVTLQVAVGGPDDDGRRRTMSRKL